MSCPEMGKKINEINRRFWDRTRGFADVSGRKPEAGHAGHAHVRLVSGATNRDHRRIGQLYSACAPTSRRWG